jgi:hypothetical protein
MAEVRCEIVEEMASLTFRIASSVVNEDGTQSRTSWKEQQISQSNPVSANVNKKLRRVYSGLLSRFNLYGLRELLRISGALPSEKASLNVVLIGAGDTLPLRRRYLGWYERKAQAIVARN